jgi:5-oxoprolinase (ATP-hydrolysing)
MMAIHTVAAGGGSILGLTAGRMRVGPESAGADPGPACYRRGGPLTVTDANLMVGKLAPGHFPALFGPDGDAPLDLDATRTLFAELAAEIGDGRAPEAVADGFIAIAVENMAQAIKTISVQRGYDPADYALACFGGAGGQHACGVADALGMDRVVIHPHASLLSAYGMGLADIRAHRQKAVGAPLGPAGLDDAAQVLNALAGEAQAELAAQGIAAGRITELRGLHIRYDGSDTALLVPWGAEADIRDGFADAHRRRFGFLFDGRALFVEAASVEAVGAAAQVAEPALDCGPPRAAVPHLDTTRFFSQGAWHEAPIVARDDIRPGEYVHGPALVIEPHSTTVVEPGWRAGRHQRGSLILERATARPKRKTIGTGADPALLEIFNNLFMGVAEQMGATLEKTAHSVKIKERLDFSCAVFDAGGGLVANAPHMPVHLGSMGESVRSVIRAGPPLRPGEVRALNAPYAGGTHLPDVTVVAPVFDPAGTEVLFYVAARGHHADIGGISPGSMPPDSTDIAQEGVLIDNFTLVADGRFREAELRALLASGPYPARNPDQNVADLQAQVAACATGIAALGGMAGQYGLSVVRAYMGHVQDNAEESVRQVVGRLTDGAFAVPLDNGATIRVVVRVDRAARTATVDFTGTSPQLASNFNAPSAVCRAAVLYVFRCLVDSDIPMNEGCLKPIDIVIPEGSMLAPRSPAAVVAGNVETSQAVVDALFGALNALAASQGTMNNLTFGNARRQYYETICGGAGAGPDFDGADAVQTHMTNSRLTDVEVLENRFPVVLERFAIRRDSGGRGRRKGGDGVVRRIRFLAPMQAAILSNRRRTVPFGLMGGGDAAPGATRIIRADGAVETLAACASAELQAGDAIEVETPGGGGFGPPECPPE